MKLTIEENEDQSEIEIKIKCSKIDKQIEDIIAYIQLYNFTIVAKCNGKKHTVKFCDVLYIDSVDDRIFLYTKKEVFQHNSKLYQLEEHLKNVNFLRISKSMLLNIKKLDHVRSLLNGKYEATLINGEKVVINRHYVSSFKEKFGL